MKLILRLSLILIFIGSLFAWTNSNGEAAPSQTHLELKSVTDFGPGAMKASAISELSTIPVPRQQPTPVGLRTARPGLCEIA